MSDTARGNAGAVRAARALFAAVFYQTAVSLLGGALKRGLRSGYVRCVHTANTAIERVDAAFAAVRVTSGASNR